MSVISVLCRRTVSRARSFFSTALALAAFLSATATLFAFNLEAAEGTHRTFVELWAVSVAPILPVLAALLGMDVWSEERRTGRADLLLSTAVRERDIVLGKFFGVWLELVLSILLSLVSSVAVLTVFAPSAVATVGVWSVCPALFILFVQGALWCAVTVFMSTCFKSAAMTATGAIVLLVGVPRGVWKAIELWYPEGRLARGELPIDAHVADFAAGVLSSSTVCLYALLTLAALFFASKTILRSRFVGRSGGRGRASCHFVSLLALVASVSLSLLAIRLDVTTEVPLVGQAAFSPRMRQILSGGSGTVTVSCFLSRREAKFRSVARFLRRLQRTANDASGFALTLDFVEPRWDLGAAERLIRLGAPEGALVFEKGRRVVILPLADEIRERDVVSSLGRLVLTPQRRDIYWTTGHGEPSCESYDTAGLSDIARDLVQEGYRNRILDLSREKTIPPDCALLVSVGAKTDFSRSELGVLNDYLKTGGRLLVLQDAPGDGGLTALLPIWGIRPISHAFTCTPTLTGSNVIVDKFSQHPVAADLQGLRIVLENPLAYAPSATAEVGAGADRLEFLPLAYADGVSVAAASERGLGSGADLAVRPTRLVVIGDASFVLNGSLIRRANANRDFFLNVVAYLSGSEIAGASAEDAGSFQTGFDRKTRNRYLAVSVIAVPLVVGLLLTFIAFRRRSRG